MSVVRCCFGCGWLVVVGFVIGVYTLWLPLSLVGWLTFALAWCVCDTDFGW